MFVTVICFIFFIILSYLLLFIIIHYYFILFYFYYYLLLFTIIIYYHLLLETITWTVSREAAWPFLLPLAFAVLAAIPWRGISAVPLALLHG